MTNTNLLARKRECLIYPNGNFVALDYASGGYPYEESDVMRAHDFKTRDAAIKYIGKFEKFTPVTVIFTIEIQR